MFSVVIDVHRNILSAQCSVRYLISDLISKMRIIVKSDCISVLFFRDLVLHHQLNISTPSNFFIPSTFSCLGKTAADVNIVNDCEGYYVESEYEVKRDPSSKLNVSEAAFRLQIMNEDLIEGTLLKSHHSIKCLDFLKANLRTRSPCQIICTVCQEILNKQPLIFESILEYKDQCSELAETWFCHNHTSIQSQLKHNACYVSELCIHLHQTVVNSMNLIVDHKSYKCGNCNSVLSDSKRSLFTGFFCDKILLKTEIDQPHNFISYKEEIALLSFNELIERNLKNSFSLKLFLHSKVSTGETNLLLWITSQRVAQYLLQSSSNDIPNETQMTTKEVYKVLYCLSPLNSEMEKSWKHDCQVEFYSISDNMMIIIVKLLEDSSNYLLNSERNHNGFKLGYLPVYVH